jgi:DNA-binding PadR family transcriptional regulator
MEVLLGLLTIQPMSGYELGQTVRESVGHFWNESYGQIYPNLKKLAGGGFVTSKAERQKGKPDRQIYSITQKGRERVATWLAVPPQPEIPRNELLLKLFFGGQAPLAISIEHVQRMMESESAILRVIGSIEKEIRKNGQYSDVPYWMMAVRFGQLELEAHQRWAQETLAELNKLAKKQRSLAAAQKEKHHGGK